MQLLTEKSSMATADEYEALYREGKELEAIEEGRTPTDFFELLIKAVEEARRERGQAEIVSNHPTQVFIRVFGLLPGSSTTSGLGNDRFQLRRELTHYL